MVTALLLSSLLLFFMPLPTPAWASSPLPEAAPAPAPSAGEEAPSLPSTAGRPHIQIASLPEEGTTWYLAEGCTGGGMQTYILVQNPGSEEAHIKLTFQTGTGEVPGPEVALPGGRRATFLANAYVPGNTDVSTKVTSDKPVICERAMYGRGWPGPTTP